MSTMFSPRVLPHLQHMCCCRGSPSPKKRLKHNRVPWLPRETTYIVDWVKANPPTLHPARKQLEFDWNKCVREGTSVLQECHQTNIKVRGRAKTLQQQQRQQQQQQRQQQQRGNLPPFLVPWVVCTNVCSKSPPAPCPPALTLFLSPRPMPPRPTPPRTLPLHVYIFRVAPPPFSCPPFS